MLKIKWWHLHCNLSFNFCRTRQGALYPLSHSTTVLWSLLTSALIWMVLLSYYICFKCKFLMSLITLIHPLRGTMKLLTSERTFCSLTWVLTIRLSVSGSVLIYFTVPKVYVSAGIANRPIFSLLLCCH